MEKTGIIGWISPSNIAIVKYWGKFKHQIPMNPSLSFTLDSSFTKTILQYKQGSGKIQFLYEGQTKPEFEDKVIRFIKKLNLSFLEEFDLIIDSENTFPHSAGIASSASSMSALTLCITEMEQRVVGEIDNFKQLASLRARIGSGSACRSIFSRASVWGQIIQFNNTSNLYAVDWSDKLHQEFRMVDDWIFLVNQSQKKISSSLGHELMNEHPYRYARIDQANKNILELIKALEIGDWGKFILICEEEALSLHALMMSSNPGYCLLEPESLRIINMIRDFREQTGLPVCFTIDAGPNIHMLFPTLIRNSVQSWLDTYFQDYIKENKIITDHIGDGPSKILSIL